MSVGSEPTTTRTVRDVIGWRLFGSTGLMRNQAEPIADSICEALGIDGSVSVEDLQRALERDAAIEALSEVTGNPVHNRLVRRLREVGRG